MYIKERFTELTDNELKKTQKELNERFAELGGKNEGYFYDNYDKETIPFYEKWYRCNIILHPENRLKNGLRKRRTTTTAEDRATHCGVGFPMFHYILCKNIDRIITDESDYEPTDADIRIEIPAPIFTNCRKLGEGSKNND